jgi:hypothetical protein
MCAAAKTSQAVLGVYLRVFGGPFPEIAVLNRMARNAEPGPARNAIVARRGDSRYAAAR